MYLLFWGNLIKVKLANGADQVLTDFSASYFYQLLKFLAPQKIVKSFISLISATNILCYFNSPNKLINLKLGVKPY